MENGVSIYLGGDYTWNEIDKFLKQCKKYGIRRYFTSLQIPEADMAVLKKDFNKLAKWCIKEKVDLICDISPNVLKVLEVASFDKVNFKKYGITTLRLDDGFSIDNIVDFIRNGYRIQLNASICTEELLEQLANRNIDLAQIDALHNYYPKPYTGLSKKYFQAMNKIIKSYGINVVAFMPDYKHPRGPFYQGLPTLEMHRNKNMQVVYAHLISLGVDGVFIGDSLPDENTLNLITNKENIFLVPIKVIDYEIWNIINKKIFTLRPEINDYSWRTVEGRSLFKEKSIPRKDILKINFGDLIINNETAMRYKGEIEIAKKYFAYENIYNIWGKIHESYLDFLEDLPLGGKIRFIII